jgi:hypothetical protein
MIPSLLWISNLLLVAIGGVLGRFAFGLSLQTAVSGGFFLDRRMKNLMGQAIHLAYS